MSIDAMRKEKEIIEQLNGLKCYAYDHMAISDCDDIWCKDYLAVKNAMLITKMFYDIWDNLDGQDLTAEMVSILSSLGYEPHHFSGLGICTEQDANRYIEYFKI